MLELLDGCHEYSSEKTIQIILILSSISVMISQEANDGISCLWHDAPHNFDSFTQQSCSYELRSWTGTFSYPYLYGYRLSFPFKKEGRLFVHFSWSIWTVMWPLYLPFFLIFSVAILWTCFLSLTRSQLIDSSVVWFVIQYQCSKSFNVVCQKPEALISLVSHSCFSWQCWKCNNKKKKVGCL